MFTAPSFESDDIKAVFYRGLPYKGKETRIFAYYGIPKAAHGRKVPAVVLVHGGAGTAFKMWVRMWMDRGYAAIAMDLEGHVPGPCDEQDELPSHTWSGPVKPRVFNDYQLPVQDQWMYHAVADVILAHSLIRSFDEVDPTQIGITGISWGGIITSLLAGVDDRFCFAVPVYGCGFLHEPGTMYGDGFSAMPEQEAERVRLLWDPSSYLARSQVPMLWLNGSNDTHFSLHIFVKSYVLNKRCHANSVLSIHPGLGHSYEEGWASEEISAFADWATQAAPGLIHLGEMKQQGNEVTVTYTSELPVRNAKLYWCNDPTEWRTANWEPYEAFLHEELSIVKTILPHANGSFFVNVTDCRGLTVSTVVMTDARVNKTEKTSLINQQ
nr:acetylxylan esterase [Paenibacillus alba]